MFIKAAAILALLSPISLAQVVGSASGFASGVTGGGDATPVEPADIDELVSYLTDTEPRVILLTKTFDFTGSEGTTTETGCRPTSNTCPGNGGQDAINGADWCGSAPPIEVTYDTAAVTAIDIAGDKSIVGVGDAGVMKGKGIRLANGISNVIVQNVHFTDLNPQYIWGGDAITLAGTDLVWIDHCKFDLVGRQMIVTGYDQAGRVTISNNEFDGVTEWSATCTGEHYWTMLFLGADDQITLSNNYIHDTSGRSPKVGGDGSIVVHAVNNYWQTNQGHAFDIATGGVVLMEGNVFEDVLQPITPQSSSDGGVIYNVPDSSAASACSSYLGRACVMNALSGSGDFGSYTDSSAAQAVGDSAIEATSADDVPASVVANAGVGKLSSGDKAPSAAPADSSAPAVSAPAAPSSFVTSVSAVPSAIASAVPSAAPSAAPVADAVSKYGLCGGKWYSGSGACTEGTACKTFNSYFAMCL